SVLACGHEGGPASVLACGHEGGPASEDACGYVPPAGFWGRKLAGGEKRVKWGCGRKKRASGLANPAGQGTIEDGGRECVVGDGGPESTSGSGSRRRSEPPCPCPPVHSWLLSGRKGNGRTHRRCLYGRRRSHHRRSRQTLGR